MDDKPGWMDVFKSVAASFFGVQSEANRQRDFTHGRPMHYIVMGLLMTFAFVLIIWGVVALILHAAGSCSG